MKAVYVAGPYRGNVRVNVANATRAGASVAKLGYAPLVPHLSMHIDPFGLLPDDYWLAATMELMRRCDAVLVVGNWRSSEGTCAEIAEAERLGIPVAYSLDELSQKVSL